MKSTWWPPSDGQRQLKSKQVYLEVLFILGSNSIQLSNTGAALPTGCMLHVSGGKENHRIFSKVRGCLFPNLKLHCGCIGAEKLYIILPSVLWLRVVGESVHTKPWHDTQFLEVQLATNGSHTWSLTLRIPKDVDMCCSCINLTCVIQCNTYPNTSV